MNIPIWPGSSSFFPGDTPFGDYDYDYEFQSTADRIATWCAQRLGYPIMDVELQARHFYMCFEEATTEFANQVNMYNARDYMLIAQGNPTSIDLTQKTIKTNLGRLISMAKNYGTEAGSGGNVDVKKGYVTSSLNQQEYDLAAWADANESGSQIEIKKVYYEAPPAIMRYFDPFVGTGYGSQQLMDSFGWGAYSPSINFMLMPLYADALRIQMIEMNDEIRKSAYSFEINNNKLRIFPIPDGTYLPNIWFDYIVVAERDNPIQNASGSYVSDLSNIPYSNMQYSKINGIGKRWIQKYTLALAKEVLGDIRGKYTTVPIPGNELTLNGTELITQGREEQTQLREELTLTLEELSRKGQMLRESEIAVAMQTQLAKVPLKIYIK